MGKSHKIWNRAKESVRKKDRIRTITEEASTKLKKKIKNTQEFGDFTTKIQTLIKMLRACIDGSYSPFSKSTILLALFAVLYFVIPTDAIPDIVPALGFTDDISVLYLVYKYIDKDVKRFLERKQEIAKKGK